MNTLIDFRPELNNYAINRIKSMDIEAFKVYRREKGYSPEGINTNLRNLRTIFKFAVDRGYLGMTPFIDVPKTKSNKTRTIPNTMRAILKNRKSTNIAPFQSTRDMVYNRVKYVLRKAGIKNASTHTLRKTAGAWYYVATRDIFATSDFLGHSSVKVTQKHYVGLIQSLQVEYSDKYEATLNSKLLIGCYFETKQDQSRLKHSIKENPALSSINRAFRGAGSTGLEPATSGLTGRRSNQTELRSQINSLDDKLALLE